MAQGFVYILCSKKHGTLYIGATLNLKRRIFEHQQNLIPGFTSQYNVFRLVHVEQFPLFIDAFARERRLKKWNRQWKIDLINKINPEWNDLTNDLMNSLND